MKPNQDRILLIQPPFRRLFKDTYSLGRYPLALGYLAGMIRKETNWSVMAYNADFSPQSEKVRVGYLASAGFDSYVHNLKDLSKSVWREVKSTISEYEPVAVGISAMSQNFASARIVAKLAKEINKQIIVIVGGPHPSMVGADVLNCPEIDIAAKGEGENTIVELLNAIDGQGQFDSIQGIIYREDGQIVENAPRQFMDDLDSLPFPHETAPEVLRNYDQYPVTAFRYILATRGCPYNCFFCGSRRIWSRKPRFRSPENVIREIGSLQQKGLRSVHFADDTFGADKQYITDLCNAFMNDCPDMKWSCEIHVKLVDEQTISLMKAAGCHSIDLGIESGNDDILRQMRKQITIEEALAACRIIKKRGIELNTFFMVGFPQETEDTLNDTVTAMKKTKCNQVAYSIFTPYPGTEAFEFCRENGLVDDNYDISLHNHQSPLNSFCMNIPPERFRALVSEVEKMVDRKNALNRIKRVFSLNTIWRIRERGINNSLRTGARIFTGR